MSQRESHVKSSGDDHHVLRHPRLAGRETVDNARARATGGPQPAPDVAARPEQALRGAEEAGGPRLRRATDDSVGRRRARATRSPPKDGAPSPPGCRNPATVRSSSSSSCSRSASPTAGARPTSSPTSKPPAPGSSTRTKRTSRRHARISKAGAHFPSARRSTSWPAASSPTSTSPSPNGSSGRRPRWRAGRTTSARPPSMSPPAEEGVRSRRAFRAFCSSRPQPGVGQFIARGATRRS